MATAVAAAFPFIEVRIDTSGLTPVAQRSPGVIAVVGKAPAGANGGTAPTNVPMQVETSADVEALFARSTAGVVTDSPLSRALKLALLQDPRPSKIYGVRVAADDYAAALASLEAADDVTFVSLAEEPAAAALLALKAHVETMSADGQKRMGVAMVNSTTPKSNTYVANVTAAVEGLKSGVGRMILVAARGAIGDVATASMAAIAGFAPHISMTLKKVRGLTMPVEQQYSPSEIKQLTEAGINPIIDPALILGESLHFADARTFSTDASLGFIDIVRVLDDLDFRLKAGLIGLIGDARITKMGMTRVKIATEGILGPLQRQQVIDTFGVDIPVLNILNLPDSAWTATDKTIVSEARANRRVDMYVTIKYGPAVHYLLVNLTPTYA